MKKIVLILLLFFIATLSAAVPGKIPVQGTLMDKDGNLISDDAAEITFVIYDAETDGNELWKEERTLFVEKGKLAIYLGEIEPVTYELIGGQDELWLSVTYDGEEMSRIQLGSVPFAHEAQVAHQAEAVGKYTETIFDDYFSSACAEGSYLRGWSGTSPICQADEGGESGGTTYTAGTGIVINGEVISIDQSIDLYVAGAGVAINDHVISIDPTLYAMTDHNHDNAYHRKDADIIIEDGSENDGSIAALHVKSGSQIMLIDGNEIDSNGVLHLNYNSEEAVDVKNDLDVGGAVSVTGNLDVGGAVSVTADLNVSGAMSSNSVDTNTMTSTNVSSSSIVNSGNIKTNTLQVSDSIQVYDSTGTVGWKKPIRIIRYDGLGNDVYKQTDFKHSEWCAAVVGFNAADMDIEESDDEDNKVYMYKSSNGYWYIVADFNSYSNHENFMVKVMYIRQELADCDDDS